MKRSDLIQEVLANFGALKQSLQSQFNDSCSELEVSMAQLHLLFNVAGSQSLTQGELAHKLHLTSGAITQMAEPLVNKGYLKRTSDPSDRRISRLSLASVGRQKIESLKSRHHAAFETALASLTVQELESFLAIEKKIINGISAN